MITYPTRRQLFITGDKTNYYKLVTVKQGSENADFYFIWDDSENSKFIVFDCLREQPELRMHDSPGKGKLSFHATGEVHFAEHNKKAISALTAMGSQIYNEAKQEIGMRHLVTILPKKPSALRSHDAPPLNKSNDAGFITENLEPCILTFFAIPNGYSIKCELHLESEPFRIPNEYPGMGTFTFKHHSILWLAYKQQGLHWPFHNHFAFSDGYHVPLFIGHGANQIEPIFVQPQYELDKQELRIKFDPASALRIEWGSNKLSPGFNR